MIFSNQYFCRSPSIIDSYSMTSPSPSSARNTQHMSLYQCLQLFVTSRSTPYGISMDRSEHFPLNVASFSSNVQSLSSFTAGHINSTVYYGSCLLCDSHDVTVGSAPHVLCLLAPFRSVFLIPLHFPSLIPFLDQ